MGGLHIELCMLSIHGELINGSGLYEVLAQSDMSIVGTQTVLSASHIKQARYCLQVASAAIYSKLREAHVKCEQGSKISPLEWLKEKSKSSQMCFYWQMILDLELHYLTFIRSIRESNFHLYVMSLKWFIKWMFALGHIHYARWLTIHLFDLCCLHLNTPDIYQEFVRGKFSFQKSMRRFSNMAPDQLHEQNNEKIKKPTIHLRYF